jgi:hypothetical protein
MRIKPRDLRVPNGHGHNTPGFRNTLYKRINELPADPVDTGFHQRKAHEREQLRAAQAYARGSK